MAGIEAVLNSWEGILSAIGPVVSILLFLAGGIVYGLAQTQPAESRGRWTTYAFGFLVGGVIVAAIVGAATLFRDTALNLLK